MANPNKKIVGMLAEFANPAELIKAAKEVRDHGYQKFDCHSPFPIHGMDQAMGLKQSPLGYIVFLMGTLGLLSGIALTWYVAVDAYPLVISGKPFFSFQAFVPVYFELTVLLSAFGAVFGMFHLNRMPQFFHNLFYSDKFAKATDDGFFVSLEASDPKFDADKAKALFESLGASDIELIESD